MKPAPIAETVKSGSLFLHVRGPYADGRFGFDHVLPDGTRRKRRHNSQKDAYDDALEKLGTTQAGKIDLLNIDPKEFGEFLRWKAQRKEGAKIPAIVKTFLESRRAKGNTKKHIRSLAGTLTPFAEEFPGDLSLLTRGDVERWLNEGGSVAPRSWNNQLACLVSMVRFARKNGLIGADLSPAEMIERKKVTVTVLTYSPEEMKTMLDACPAKWLPQLVFGAFCGLRPEESCPDNGSAKPCLQWEDVDWRRGKVVVRAEVAKDRRKRFAPLTDAAKAFLLPWKGEKGRTTPTDRTDQAFAKFKRDCGVVWKPDALRHSFASYWLATFPDAPALALLMGNSPAMIYRHYLDVQFPEVAARWWGIRPVQAAR